MGVDHFGNCIQSSRRVFICASSIFSATVPLRCAAELWFIANVTDRLIGMGR